MNIAGPGALNTGATPFVGTFSQNDITLGPGQNLEFMFRTGHDTRDVRMALSDVVAGANPNPLAQAAFPNSVEVYVHEAERGGTGFPLGYYVHSTNVVGDATFTIRDLSTAVQGAVFGTFLTNRPIMPGFTKVVVEGDWSNGAPVSFDLTITVEGGAPTGSVLASGTVAQDEFASLARSTCNAGSSSSCGGRPTGPPTPPMTWTCTSSRRRTSRPSQSGRGDHRFPRADRARRWREVLPRCPRIPRLQRRRGALGDSGDLALGLPPGRAGRGRRLGMLRTERSERELHAVVWQHKPSSKPSRTGLSVGSGRRVTRSCWCVDRRSPRFIAGADAIVLAEQKVADLQADIKLNPGEIHLARG